LGVGSAGRAFDPEEVGGTDNKADGLVWCDGKKLGKEIVFAAEACHWRDSTKRIVAADPPEAGR
jgi:hypothetical protein